MHADELLKLYALGEKSFNQATLISVKPIRAEADVTKPDGTKLDGAIMSGGVMYLIPIGFMMVWAIFFFRLSNAWKGTRNGMPTIKHLHQVPCKNCQFFTNNPYLKCAVHPSIALTEQAINCSDYSPCQNRRT